jgi:DNA primase
VKDAMRIEDVLGEFLDLKRKGPRYLGLCPFHNEKTPSFNVSPQLGIYKCFGCGESGDAISFLEKAGAPLLHGGDPLAGQALPHRAGGRGTARRSNSWSRASAKASPWCSNGPCNGAWTSCGTPRKASEHRLSYFHERGFRDELIREFQLGYVPERGDAFAKPPSPTASSGPAGESGLDQSAATTVMRGISSKAASPSPSMAWPGSPSPSARAP